MPKRVEILDFEVKKKNAVRTCVSVTLRCVVWNGIWTWAENLLCILAQQQWINKQQQRIDGNNYHPANFPRTHSMKLPWLIMLVGFNKIQHISNEICMTWTNRCKKRRSSRKKEQCACIVVAQKRRSNVCMCVWCVCVFKWFFPVCNHLHSFGLRWLLYSMWRCIEALGVRMVSSKVPMPMQIRG